MKNCLGIEIGHYRIKIAYAEKGELKEFISERVQGMDLTDMQTEASERKLPQSPVQMGFSPFSKPTNIRFQAHS